MDMLIYSLSALIGYPYLIYPGLSFFISRFSSYKSVTGSLNTYPSVTLVIAAYNEIGCIGKKLDNSYELLYPTELLKVLVITDGSTDGTDLAVLRDGRAKLLHDAERKGKAAAINRTIDLIETDIVVFTDANTMLNKEALYALVKHFQDISVGAVAGEKRVRGINNNGITQTEGFYWKYESKLRQWDSDAYAVTGAVGELYAIRRQWLAPVPDNTICEDLLMTMRVIEAGKRVVYEPGAYGTETVSETLLGEWKRKVRIAAGCIQFVQRMKWLRLCRRYPFAAFQFISHKLFRWLIVPYSLILLLMVGMFQLLHTGNQMVMILCLLQCIFYCWAFVGWLCRKQQWLPAIFFFPFYFLMANLAIIVGTFQYIGGRSFVLWERVQR